MNEISIRLKTDQISWEELADLQHRAHAGNMAAGVRMKIADCTEEELCNEVGNGMTLVAQDASGRLLGTISVCFSQVKRWWHHGEGAYLCCIAVDPDFQHCGVYKALNESVEEIIAEHGVHVAYLNTHIDNKVARQAYEKIGYQLVRFSPGGGPGYYSVEMAKWFNGHGKSKFLCKLMFLATEVAVRILFKPGRVRRF